MYYHILIETAEKLGKSGKNKVITEIDICDKAEIIEDVLIHYINGDEFIVDGYKLSRDLIQRLKISTTQKSARELADYENENMPEELIGYVSPERILSYDQYNTDVTKQLIAETKEIMKKGESIVEKQKTTIDKNKIFIVHGHDNEAKTETARFIEKLGLEAIILHEQVNNGMTIIEKIESCSDIGFCIILYTPCDIGYNKEDEDKKQERARQNVVFEHGYMIAKLGRKNVCALVKGDIEKPNDISGVVYIPMDSHGGWKLPLAKEMKSSGCNIDLNLIV